MIFGSSVRVICNSEDTKYDFDHELCLQAFIRTQGYHPNPEGVSATRRNQILLAQCGNTLLYKARFLHFRPMETYLITTQITARNQVLSCISHLYLLFRILKMLGF